jgi:hypothetical protein
MNDKVRETFFPKEFQRSYTSWKPIPSMEMEIALLHDSIYHDVIWGTRNLPRMCVKFPENNNPLKAAKCSDYGWTAPMPAGTRLFVPADSNEDYDLITSVPLSPMRSAEFNRDSVLCAVQNKVLPLMDIDSPVDTFTATTVGGRIGGRISITDAKHTYGNKPVEFIVGNNISGKAMLTESNAFGLLYASGSNHVHHYGYGMVPADGFTEIIQRLNSSWTQHGKKQGFYSLRPPFKPKELPAMPHIKEAVLRLNCHVRRELYSRKEHVELPKLMPDLGWEYYVPLGEQVYWHDIQHDAEFTPYLHEGVPMAERVMDALRFNRDDPDGLGLTERKVHDMMTAEANRIRSLMESGGKR